MNIVNLSDTAKSVLNDKDYNVLMKHVNNRNLTSARVFIEDTVENLITITRLDNLGYQHEKVRRLQLIDNIITEEILSKTKPNGISEISK